MTTPESNQERAPIAPATGHDETMPFPSPSRSTGPDGETAPSMAAVDARRAESAAGTAQGQAERAQDAAGEARAQARAPRAWPLAVPRREPIVTYFREHPGVATGTAAALALIACGGGFLLAKLTQTGELYESGKPVPTAPAGAPGSGGGSCTVTELFHDTPNGNPVTITVKPHETVEGGLWWQDGNQQGFPWGTAEVGVQFQGGDNGMTVTTRGSAGGSLWEYSKACSQARIATDRANYGAERRGVTNFSGDESLSQLQTAGAITSSQDALRATPPVLDIRVATAMHDRIAERKAARTKGLRKV